MKKLVLACFLLASISALAEGNQTHIYGKLGVDLYSKYNKVTSEKSSDLTESNLTVFDSKKGRGVSVFLEATRDITPNTELGLGIGYTHRGNGKTEYNNVKETFNGKTEEYSEISNTPRYRSIPLYILAKYNFNSENAWKPYVKADLGYSFNKENKSVHSTAIYQDGTKETETTNIKVKNGLYAGITTGVEYNNVLTELSYHITKTKVTWDDDEKTKDNYSNHAIQFSVGYKFNF